jgi:hypothetical protein
MVPHVSLFVNDLLLYLLITSEPNQHIRLEKSSQSSFGFVVFVLLVWFLNVLLCQSNAQIKLMLMQYILYDFLHNKQC